MKVDIKKYVPIFTYSLNEYAWVSNTITYSQKVVHHPIGIQLIKILCYDR